MRFVLKLVSVGLLTSRAYATRPPPYSISPNCELISVQNIDEVTENYLEILTFPTLCVLFQIKDTNTFLIRKSKRRWNYASSLESLSRITGKSFFPSISGSSRFSLFKRFAKVRDEFLWVELYFDDFEHRSTGGQVPISPCHSEILGDGTVVSFQTVFLSNIGGTGGLTADFDIWSFVIGVAADTTLETAKAFSLKIRCNIGRGEVGQLLLANTRYLYYTPSYRILIFNLKTMQFSKEDGFKKQKRERRIIKGGIGDWECATSSVAELQCNSVGGGSTFWT